MFGHYWRVPLPVDGNEQLFDEARPYAPLGNGWALCIDSSVGKRWYERVVFPGNYRTALAALRWPERLLVLDDGREVPVV